MTETYLRRRDFLIGSASVYAALGGIRFANAMMTPDRQAIDVHYHVTTDAMRRAAEQLDGVSKTVANLPVWQASEALEQMDQSGVALSVISMPVTSPTAPQKQADHELFARTANEAAAEICRNYPDRFRFFAYLPVPFLDSALREASYAVDELGADGIYLCTSYGDKWLGDRYFEPLLEEFNRRSWVVYTHPMGADCCYQSLVPDVPSHIIEYGTDTSRTIASLIFSGAAMRYPDIKFIFSHAGGTMPFLFERFEGQLAAQDPKTDIRMQELVSRFYYDTAQVANPYALGTLLKLVPDTQVLFGSDSPWRNPGQQLEAIEHLGLENDSVQAIFRNNASRLLGLQGMTQEHSE